MRISSGRSSRGAYETRESDSGSVECGGNSVPLLVWRLDPEAVKLAKKVLPDEVIMGEF